MLSNREDSIDGKLFAAEAKCLVDCFEDGNLESAGGVLRHVATGRLIDVEADDIDSRIGAFAVEQIRLQKVFQQDVRMRAVLKHGHDDRHFRATFRGGGPQRCRRRNDRCSQRRSGDSQYIAARKLGSFSAGYLDTLMKGGSNDLIDGNRETAQQVVDAAITQVSTLRGRLGAFQKNILQSTINALGIAGENTAAAESITRDTDFASETASLTRAQILVNASL